MKKKDINKMPDIEIQGWNVKELAEQATNQETDEIYKQILSGGKTKKGSTLPDINGYEIENPVNVKKDEN